MKKFSKILILVFSISLIFLLKYVLLSFPNFIVSANVLTNGLYVYREIIEGFLYFLIYTFVIIFALAIFKSSTTEGAFKGGIKTFLRTILPLLLIYICIDLIKVYIVQLHLTSYLPIWLLLHTLYTIIAFVIINRSLKKTLCSMRNLKENSKGKTLWYSIIIISMVVSYILCSIFIVNSTNNAMLFFEKYSFGGYIDITGMAANKDMEIHFIYILHNILICSGLTIIFSGYLFTEPKEKEKISPKPIIIIASLFLVFIGIEVFLLPQDNMYLAENPYNYIDENEVKDDFSTDYSIFAINRESAFSPVAFQSKTTTINYKNEKIRSFSTASGAGTDEFEKLDTKQSTAYRYNDEALVYLDNGEPKVILSTELNQQEENEVLTEVLEAAVSEGYFVFLENSCEYMLKYDKDFIVPYIERYAKGDLTEAEQEINGYINMDYMQNFAQNIDVN